MSGRVVGGADAVCECCWRAPSSMRSWITMETQKMISSMHGLEMVESMYRDDVELYLTWLGFICICAARARGARSVGGRKMRSQRREIGACGCFASILSAIPGISSLSSAFCSFFLWPGTLIPSSSRCSSLRSRSCVGSVHPFSRKFCLYLLCEGVGGV